MNQSKVCLAKQLSRTTVWSPSIPWFLGIEIIASASHFEHKSTTQNHWLFAEFTESPPFMKAHVYVCCFVFRMLCPPKQAHRSPARENFVQLTNIWRVKNSKLFRANVCSCWLINDCCVWQLCGHLESHKHELTWTTTTSSIKLLITRRPINNFLLPPRKVITTMNRTECNWNTTIACSAKSDKGLAFRFS